MFGCCFLKTSPQMLGAAAYRAERVAVRTAHPCSMSAGCAAYTPTQESCVKGSLTPWGQRSANMMSCSHACLPMHAVRGAQMDTHRAEAAAARRALQDDLDASRVCSSWPLPEASSLHAVAPLHDPSHAPHVVCLRCSVARSQRQPRACPDAAAPGAPPAPVRPGRRGAPPGGAAGGGRGARARGALAAGLGGGPARGARRRGAPARGPCVRRPAARRLARGAGAAPPLPPPIVPPAPARPACVTDARLCTSLPASRARFCTRPGLSALTTAQAMAAQRGSI